MALLKFLSWRTNYVHDSTEASVLSKTEVEAANKQVSNALQSAAEKVSRGKYNSYMPQQRAKIGKYAAENVAPPPQFIVPPRLKNSEQAADSFLGTWPITLAPLLMATA